MRTVDDLLAAFRDDVVDNAEPQLWSDDDALAGRQCLLFACALGVCLGRPDGSVVNLTYDRYQSNMGLIGSAVLRTEAVLTQYLLAMHDET